MTGRSECGIRGINHSLRVVPLQEIITFGTVTVTPPGCLFSCNSVGVDVLLPHSQISLLPLQLSEAAALLHYP